MKYYFKKISTFIIVYTEKVLFTPLKRKISAKTQRIFYRCFFCDFADFSGFAVLKRGFLALTITVFFLLLIINSFLFIPFVYAQEWGNDPLDIMSPSSSSDSWGTPVSQQSLAINLAQAQSELLDKVEDGDVSALNQLGDELVGNTLTTAEKQQVIYELTQIAKKSSTNSSIKPEIAKLLVNTAEGKDRNGKVVTIDKDVRKSAISALYTVVKSVNITITQKEGIVNSLSGIIQNDQDAEIKETAVDTMVNILMKDVGLGSSTKESAILGLLASIKDTSLSDGIKEKTLTALGRLAKGPRISAETKEKMLVSLVEIIGDETIDITVREAALLSAVRIIKSPSFYAEATAIDSLLDIAEDKTKSDETRELVISGLATIVRSSDVDIEQREDITLRLLVVAQDTNDKIEIRESAFFALPLARLAKSSAIKAFPTKALMLDYLLKIAQDTAFSDAVRGTAVEVIGILIRDPNNAAKRDNKGEEIPNTGIVLSFKISTVESLLEDIAKDENESDDLRLAVLLVLKRIARSLAVDVSIKEVMIQPLTDIVNDGNTNEEVRIASIYVLAVAAKNRNIAESTRQTITTVLANTAQNGNNSDAIRINSLAAISSILSKEFVDPAIKERLVVSLSLIANDETSGAWVRDYALDVLTNIAGDDKVNSTIKEGVVQTLVDIANDESLKPADNTTPDIRIKALLALARIANDTDVSAAVKEGMVPVMLELALKEELTGGKHTNLEIRKGALSVLDNIAQDVEVGSALKQAMIEPLKEIAKDNTLKPEKDADGKDKSPDIRKTALSILGTIVKDVKLKILDTDNVDKTNDIKTDIVEFILNDIVKNGPADDEIRKDALVILNTIAKDPTVDHTNKENWLIQPLLDFAKTGAASDFTLELRNSALLVLESIVKDEKVDAVKKGGMVEELLEVAKNTGLKPGQNSNAPDIRSKAIAVLGLIAKDEYVDANEKKKIVDTAGADNDLLDLVLKTTTDDYIRKAALVVLIDAARYASAAVQQVMVFRAGADNDLMDIANNETLDETMRKNALLVISTVIDSAGVSKTTKEWLIVTDSLKNIAYNDDLNFGTRGAALLVIAAIARDGSATSVDAAMKIKLIEYLEEIANDGNIELWQASVSLDTWPVKGVNLIHQADGSDWLVYNEIDVVVNGVTVKVKNGVKKETYIDPKDNKTKTRLVLFGVLSKTDKDTLKGMVDAVKNSADNSEEMKTDFEMGIDGIIMRSESHQTSAVDLRRHALTALGFIIRGADTTNRQGIITFLMDKILHDPEEEIIKSALTAFGDVIRDVNLSDIALKQQSVAVLLVFATDVHQTVYIQTTALSVLADAANDSKVDPLIKEEMITAATNIMTIIENKALTIGVRKAALSVLDNIVKDPDVGISVKYDTVDNLFALVKSADAELELKKSAISVIGSIFNATLQSSAPLANLPTGLIFPDSVKEKISYDVNKKTLTFRGFMTDAEKTELKKLSSDTTYQNAIDTLYNDTADKYTKANSLIDDLFGVVFDGGVQTDVKNGAVNILRSIAMDTSVGAGIKERLIDNAGANNDLKDIANNTNFTDEQAYIRTNALTVLREIINDKDVSLVKKQEIIAFLLDKVENDTNLNMKKTALGLIADIVKDGAVDAALKEGMIGSLLNIAYSAALDIVINDPNLTPQQIDKIKADERVKLRLQALQTLGSIARDTNVSEAAKKDLADNGLTDIFNNSKNPEMRKAALWILGDIAMAGNITDPAIKNSVADKLINWAKDITLAVDLRKTALWVLDAIIRSGSLTTSSVALNTLPLQGVLDSIPDADLRAKISYDASRKVLIFEGAMTSAERTSLKSMSVDTAYQNAIDALYVASNTTLQTTAPLASIPVPNMFNYPDSAILDFTKFPYPESILQTDSIYWLLPNKLELKYISNKWTLVLHDVLNEADKEHLKTAYGTSMDEIIYMSQYYLPPSVKAKISYDSTKKRVVFKGVMSLADKEALKKLLPADYEYQGAIDVLFDASNALAVTNSYATLSQMPVGIGLIFTSDGKTWIVKDKLEVQNNGDPDKPLILRFTGVMTQTERTDLKALSTDAAWQNAVDKLYDLSNTVPQASAPLDSLDQTVIDSFFYYSTNLVFSYSSQWLYPMVPLTTANGKQWLIANKVEYSYDSINYMQSLILRGALTQTEIDTLNGMINTVNASGLDVSLKMAFETAVTSIINNFKETKISYDSTKKRLNYKGVMSQSERDKLKTLSQDIAYRNAIDALYAVSNAATEISVPLDSIPGGTTFPDSLQDKVSYDPNSKQLIFKGVMTEDDLAALLALSTGSTQADTDYKQAVNDLYAKAKDTGPAQTFIKDNIVTPLFGIAADVSLDTDIRKIALWVLGDVARDENVSGTIKEGMVEPLTNIVKNVNLDIETQKAALWVLGDVAIGASDAKKAELITLMKDIVTASAVVGNLAIDLRKTALWVLGNIVLEDDTFTDAEKVGLLYFLRDEATATSLDIDLRETALWVLGRIARLADETAGVTTTGRNIKQEAIYDLFMVTSLSRMTGLTIDDIEMKKTAYWVLGSIVKDFYVSDTIKKNILEGGDGYSGIVLHLSPYVSWQTNVEIKKTIIDVLSDIVRDTTVSSAIRLNIIYRENDPRRSYDLYSYVLNRDLYDSQIREKAVEVLIDIIRALGCSFSKTYTNPSDETPGDGIDDTVTLNITEAVKKGDKIIMKDDKGTPDEGDDTVLIQDDTYVNSGILDTLFTVMKSDPDANVRQAVKLGLYAILDDPLGSDGIKQKIIDFLNANPGL